MSLLADTRYACCSRGRPTSVPSLKTTQSSPRTTPSPPAPPAVQRRPSSAGLPPVAPVAHRRLSASGLPQYTAPNPLHSVPVGALFGLESPTQGLCMASLQTSDGTASKVWMMRQHDALTGSMVLCRCWEAAQAAQLKRTALWPTQRAWQLREPGQKQPAGHPDCAPGTHSPGPRGCATAA